MIGTSRHPEKLTKEILKNRYLEMHTKYRIKHRNSPNESLIKGKIHVPNEILNNLDKYIEDIEYQSLDITDSRSASEIIPKIMAKGVDILVNNAGDGHFGPIETLSIENAEEQLDLNYFGHLRVLQSALPYLRKNGGFIVNIASLGGFLPLPFHSHYSTSKAAVRMLTETLWLELHPFDIKVACLNPGVINTPFNVNMHTPQAGTGKETFEYSEENSITFYGN